MYAYQQLLKIYQQERDWQQAIDTAKKLEKVSLDDLKPMVAQFYCEQADVQRKNNQLNHSKKLFHYALSVDKNCIRANLMAGRLAISQQQFTTAISALKQVEQQNPRYLTEVVEPLQISYLALNQKKDFIHYLTNIIKKHGECVPIQPLIQFIKEQDGDLSALQFLSKRLTTHPSLQGIDSFINLTLAHPNNECKQDLNLLQQSILQLLKKRPDYQCESCGFSGKTLHWQCPRCKQWNTIQPLLN